MRAGIILIRDFLILRLNKWSGQLFFSLLIAVLISSHTQIIASVYYVSTTGSDSNSGSLTRPFRTIGKGVKILKAGDFLYVRGGIYVEKVIISQSGTNVLPVTISGYEGETAVIDGQNSLPGGNWSSLVQLQGEYIYFSGFEVRNSNMSAKYEGGAGVEIYGSHNKVSRLKVHHCRENGIIALGDYSIVEDCEVWQAAMSNSQNPGSGSWASGLSAARSPADGITSGAVLRRNIVFNNWGEGISTFEAEGTIIEDNIIYDNWSVNLYVSDARNVLVQRNIVYNTPGNQVGQRRPFTLGDERADKPRSANNTVINNLIYNADLWAFWSTGVPGSGLDNVLIAHNTIVNGQLQAGNSISDGSVIKSAVIENNIFINTNGNPWKVMGSLSKITFSNNLWSSSPPSALAGKGDLTGDPHLSKTGSAGPGELTAAYFRLTVNSPAINAGKAISIVPEDFFGSTRDFNPDIGGCEYNVEGEVIKVTRILVASEGGDSVIRGFRRNLHLKSSVLPSNASNKTVTWSLVNESGHASISSAGLVTSISSGNVTAVAKANDGSGTEAVFKIKIEGIKTLDLITNQDELVVFIDDKYINYKLNLVNLNGQLIASKNAENNLCNFDISSLLPGIYIVTLSGSTIIESSRFIIATNNKR